MFKTVKYYDSADVMPIGRYMLAICRDMRYFAISPDLPKRLNKLRLKKAVKSVNSTIFKNQDQKQLLKDLTQLGKDEGNIYMYSVLMSMVDYCNKLIDAGVDQKVILSKLKPIQPLLIQRGLTPNTNRNISRLDKITRNFKIKSDALKNQTKNEKANKEKVYESYLRNLVVIEKTFGVKIDEQRDSINKYVMLIDEISKHGNRPK